jgi:transcriptional regulator with XRE-family HTH domain
MYNLAEKIKVLAEINGNSLAWLADKIGMTKVGFYKMLNSNSFKVETLQKIADHYHVPMEFFFTDNLNNLTWIARVYQMVALATIDKLEKVITNSHENIEVPELQNVLQWARARYQDAENFAYRNFNQQQVQAIKEFQKKLWESAKAAALENQEVTEENARVLFKKLTDDLEALSE